MRFADFVEINPRVRLNKGSIYPFVAMEIVTPGSRYIKTKTTREYTGGGSKFCSGDTLFARITPCLENGKIAQFINHEPKDGFGSTEFFVFRARENVSIPPFVYYLVSTDIIRGPAEKSMTGASGRQRAELKAIENLEISSFSISAQHKIASILSAYDELIENNNRRIKILEEMAQAIYREWFTYPFRGVMGTPSPQPSPTGRGCRKAGEGSVRLVKSELGMIPEGWEAKKLGDICIIVMGQSPKSEFYNEDGNGLPFHQGVTDFGHRFPSDRVYCTVRNRIGEAGDILFSVRAPVGQINISNKKIVIGRGLSAIRSKTGNQSFVFHQLKERFQETDTMGGGTIFKSVTKEDVHDIKMIEPSNKILTRFEEIIKPVFSKLEILTNKNIILRKTRDLLLPKLISGEIDVEGMDIRIPEGNGNA